MPPMAIDRRSFAAGVVSLAASAALPASARAALMRSTIAATVRRRDGSFAAVLYDLSRGLVNSADLPGRGHDVAISLVTREAVALARRPGVFAVAFGENAGRPPVFFTAPPGRHFCGHGIFSRDGRLFYTTENAYEQGRGVIGIWDVAAGYQRVEELATHGIGPHDINLLEDGRTLVVANGGILTHPDHGRRPLNLATMQPSLAYLDSRTGDLLDQALLPDRLHMLSIRHLDVAASGTVVFGCQFKGPKTEQVDLIGFHRRGTEIALLPSDPAIHRALRHYVSSVAVDRAGEIAAITSSRGQQAVFIDVHGRRVVGVRDFTDVSGVAAGHRRGELILTGGNGDVDVVAASAPKHHGPARQAPWSWDNHATSY